MSNLRLFVIALCFTFIAGDVAKKDVTKLIELKGKANKRDSTDRTGNYLDRTKEDEPFRPIFPGQYQSGSASTSASASASSSGLGHQAYYDKNALTLTAGTRYAAAPTTAAATGPVAHHRHSPTSATSHAVEYAASSAYQGGPYHPHYHAAQQHQQQQQQQQQQQSHRVTGIYANVDSNYLNDELRPPPQESQHQHQPQSQPQRLSPHQHQQQQQHQQLQYVIAIPLSYMRQLQQQLLGHASPPYALPSHPHGVSVVATNPLLPPPAPAAALAAAPQPPPHGVGPLARDHTGVYRPVHQQYAPPAATAADTAPPGYVTKYIEVPASTLLAAAEAAGIYQNQRQPQYQNVIGAYPQNQQLTYPSYEVHQSAFDVPQHQQQHQHHQQYEEQQRPQHHQQQQHQQQHFEYQQQKLQQHHQQKPKQQQVVRIGAAKSKVKLSTANNSPSASVSAPSLPAPAPAHVAPYSLLPPLQRIVHYNPFYVQPPPPPPPPLQSPSAGAKPLHFLGPLSFARYGQGLSLPYGGAHSSIHQTTPQADLSSPSVHYVTPQGHHAPPQYHHFYTPAHFPFYNGLGVKPTASAVAAASQSPSSADYEQGFGPAHIPIPPALPYLKQPGAVLYGTHLFHPPAANLHAKAAAAAAESPAASASASAPASPGSSPATPNGSNHQQHPGAGQGASDSNSSATAAGVVKYP